MKENRQPDEWVAIRMQHHTPGKVGLEREEARAAATQARGIAQNPSLC